LDLCKSSYFIHRLLLYRLEIYKFVSFISFFSISSLFFVRGLSAWFEFHSSLSDDFLLNNHRFEAIVGSVAFKSVVMSENAFSKLLGRTHGTLLIVGRNSLLAEQSDVTFL